MFVSWETVIIGLARIAGSLPVLRWAFAGAIIAILVDFSDLFMKNLLDLGGLDPNYQQFDKYVDLVYMATFLIVALRWDGIARNVAVGLFAFRMVGFAVFEVTTERAILLAFPNVFEFWFVFVAALKHWWPRYRLTWRRTAAWMVPLLAAKEFQEYVLHGGQWLEKWTAVEVVSMWWDFFTSW